MRAALYSFSIISGHSCLIEANQDRIDENKREIERAFKECSNSIVLFLRSQSVAKQNDDVIAFNALYEAFEFPESSLAFVVNNLPLSRPAVYDSNFISTLSTMLAPQTYSVSHFVFVDNIEDLQSAAAVTTRLNLLALINSHRAATQLQRKAISVPLHQLAEMRTQDEAQEHRRSCEEQLVAMEQMRQATQEQAKIEMEWLRMEAEASRSVIIYGGGCLLL